LCACARHWMSWRGCGDGVKNNHLTSGAPLA
jgi:hypothetical protein